LLIVFILAMGIGLGSAFYSVAQVLLLRPLPFSGPDQLMDVEEHLQRDGTRVMTSIENLDEMGKLSSTLEGVAAYKEYSGAVTASGQTEYAEGMKVDHHFFPILRVSPALGRGFNSEDDRYGAPGTIILSYTFWQRRFAGDPQILDRNVLLNGQPYAVIGVMPQLFYFPYLDVSREDFWLPFQESPEARQGNYDKYGIARIKSGATLQEAQTEAAQIGRQISLANPRKDFYFRLRSYREVLVEGFGALLYILAGIIVGVQLVVCVNVASLLLVEALRCRKEVEIRYALGGTRWRIAGLFLLRAVALVFAGGITGAGLAVGFVLLTRRLLPAGFPGTERIALDTSVLGLTILASAGTGVFFGLWPALQVTKKLEDLSLNRAGGAAQSSVAARSLRRSRKLLVMLQLASSSAFLVVAALLGMSLYRLLNVDLGIRLDHRLLVSLAPTGLETKPEALQQFLLSAENQLLVVPGVADVTVSSDAPLTGHGERGFRIKDALLPKDMRDWQASAETVATNYFQVLGMTVRQGRPFTDDDRQGGRPVAVVNEAFAKRFFGGESPLGKQICISSDNCPWREIVGIVSNARASRVDGPLEPVCYIPFWQAQPGFLNYATLILRSRIPPSSLVRPVQAKMQELVPGAVRMGPITLEELRSRQLTGARYRVWFLAIIAILALSLAALGVYGVIAGDVERRRREIGVRIALGASPRQIWGLFQSQMFFLLIPGVLLGLAAANVLVRYATSILFGINPVEPLAYVGTALALSFTAVISTALPVRRALRESTADVLRAE
jgi:predicted permease